MIATTGQLLRGLLRISCRRPAVTVALSLVAGALSLVYALDALTFKTSTRALLPHHASYVIRAEEYDKDFGDLEDIVVVVEAGSFDDARAYATRLVQELRASPVRFRRIAYRIDPERFQGRQLLYLSTAELTAIRDKIFDHQELMESFVGDPTLLRLVDGINAQVASAFVSHMFDIGLQDTDLPVDTRFVRLLLDQISSHLDRSARYQSPWRAFFSVEQEPTDVGYFVSDDKSLLFILVEVPPGDGSFVSDRAAIQAIRRTIASLRSEFPWIRAGVTGVPVLSNDEMSAAFHDSRLATVLAALLTLLVMVVAFGRVGKPLLMLAVLAVSLAWSLGVVTATIGHLTLFSVMFISVVIGIGIDYGIYFLFRYEEERRVGRALTEALEITAARTGPGMLVGALTAAGTFLVLMLTDFRGIQELGFVAGISILLAWLGMMTFFPAVLVLVDRRSASREARKSADRRVRIDVPVLDRLTSYPITVLALAAIATALSLAMLPTVGFDYNLLHLQAKNSESVVWEQRMLGGTGRSGANGVTTASTLEELRQRAAAFAHLPSVSEVDSLLQVMPDHQAEKLRIIASLARVVAPIRVGRPSPVDLPRMKQALRSVQRRFDLMISEAGDRAPAELTVIRDKTRAIVRELDRMGARAAAAALNTLQGRLYRDFVDDFSVLQRNLAPRRVRIQDVPEELRRKFIGASGRFLLQIQPRVNIWDRTGAAQFVKELRSVDPDVTGAPIISYEATRRMERAYLQGSAYALIVVGALGVWMLRRARETLLALCPLVLALVWTIGLMHAFGIRFNLVNIWALPMIIGISAEFGLNVVLRYLEGSVDDGPLVARSTVMGVMMNGLTTIVGFGSLMIASHQGIFSLGLLLTIGTASGLAASLVVLPVILRLCRQPAPAAVSSPTVAKA